LQTPEVGFVVLRLLTPFSMSPALPLMWLVLGALVWSLYALARVHRLDRFVSRRLGAMRRMPVRPLRALWIELYWPWARSKAWLPWGLLTVLLSWRIVRRADDSFEGAAFDGAFRVLFLILSALIAAEIVRFLTLSNLLVTAARELAASPMVVAYDRISKRVSGTFGLQLSARVPRANELVFSVFSSRTLASLALQTWPLWPSNARLELQASEVRDKALQLRASREPINVRERAVHDSLYAITQTLHRMVVTRWRDRAYNVQAEALEGKLAKSDLLPGGKFVLSPTFLLLENAAPFDRSIWLRGAEDFIALRVSTFVYQVLHELRHTLTFALVGSLLLALSVLSYPFRIGNWLQNYTWSVVIFVVLIGLRRMLALERNELLSRLGGSRPDRIDWSANFVHQLLLFVVLPLAAVVIGVFPSLGDAFASQIGMLIRLASLPN
jgi:hypothetical protein